MSDTKHIPRPKNPSRQEILDTVGDPGMDKWRNPLHVKAVTKTWPHPQTDEARDEKPITRMEMTPSHRNGSIPR
jgi:hypothetical protein